MSNIEADQLRIAFATERRAWEAREARLRALLRDCWEVLDNYSDVVDGEDGTPRANAAMALLHEIEQVLPYVGWVCERHRTALPPMAALSPYAAIYSALGDASHRVRDVLAEIPCGPRTYTLQLHWTRWTKPSMTLWATLALEADEARRAAGDEV